MNNNQTKLIVLGMVLGIIVGHLINIQFGDSETTAKIAELLKLLADIFMRLIKMIIAPLIIATIVTGIAHLGDSAALGRIGTRAIIWFFCASVLSLSIGMLLANLFQPGLGLGEFTKGAVAENTISTMPNFREFVLKIFPTSVFDALATNNVLQLLVFSIFAGVALSALGKNGDLLIKGFEQLTELMLLVTNYVMRFAPFAVFGALAAVVATEGLGILWSFGKLIGEFYLGLAILWSCLIGVGFLFLGKSVITLIRYVREPFLIAFSTASSEAALPKFLEQLDRFGVPRRISGFMLPLGYSFNLDGSMMYMSFATLFIAQAYNVDLSWQVQIILLLTLMVTSKGIASVPRASLVVVSATLASFGLPIEGVALLLSIDQILDMGRTGTNIIGNAVATASIAKWEGMLEVREPAEADFPHAPAHTIADGRAGLDLDPSAVKEASPKSSVKKKAS
jgi:Na+/H+-dicarboxylate symporter